MSIYILNLNDTIVLKDNMVEKLTKATGDSLCRMNEAATNWADVEIMKQITWAVVMVAAICVAGYILVKLIEVISKHYSEERKKKWDEKECVRKQKAVLWNMKLSALGKGPEEYIVVSALGKDLNKYLEEIDNALKDINESSK